MRHCVKRFAKRGLQDVNRQERNAVWYATHDEMSGAIPICGLTFVRRCVKRFAKKGLQGVSRHERHAARYARHDAMSGAIPMCGPKLVRRCVRHFATGTDKRGARNTTGRAK